MDRSLDRTLGGFTELRLHGVSGTAPDAMLQHPHPKLVAGDQVSGFYRRWNPNGGTPDDPDKEHREAYSWGGFTSGSGSRALWLLLLPFMLINVSSWMHPPDPSPGKVHPLRGVLSSVLRLLALTLTGTLVLSIAGASLDLIAWQCAQKRSGSTCPNRLGVLRFLADSYGSQPLRRTVIAALLPLGVILLLGYLGRKTWQQNEQVLMRPAPLLPNPLELQRREFWNGSSAVRRLRSQHVTAALALLALLVTYPAVDHLTWLASSHDTEPAWVRWLWLGRGLLFLDGLLLVATLVVVLLPWVGDRRPTPDEDDQSRWDRVIGWMKWAAAGLLGLAAAYAWGNWPDQHVTGALPGFHWALNRTLVLQLSSIAALLVLTLVLRARGQAGRANDAKAPRPAMGGFGLVLVASLAWQVANAFTAGLGLRVAGLFGKAVPDAATQQKELLGLQQLLADPTKPFAEKLAAAQEPAPLIVPAPYFWAGLLAGLLLILVIALALRALFVVIGRRARGIQPGLRQRHLPRQPPGVEPPPSSPLTLEERRIRAIAREQAWASMTDSAGRVAAGVLWVALGLVAIAWLCYFVLDRYRDLPWRLSPLTDLGTLLIGAAVLGLIALARYMYRNQQLRRTVGILWDLGTFWPRASHPLAPPCYCERALPDLTRRVEALTSQPGDLVVLSAHSQGSVIAAALILQLEDEQRKRVRLLTYGSPLRRLYTRYFPAYFSPAMLEQLGSLLAPDTQAAQPKPMPQPSWGWRNLFRRTDPIGGWLFEDAEIDTDDGRVDRQLEDPAFSRAHGDTVDPRTRGHSDYFDDPVYEESVKLLRRMHSDPRSHIRA